VEATEKGDPDARQDHVDQTQDSASICEAFALGVHSAGAHFLQVVVAQNPGHQAEYWAHSPTEDSKHENHYAAVRVIIGYATPAARSIVTVVIVIVAVAAAETPYPRLFPISFVAVIAATGGRLCSQALLARWRRPGVGFK
jgi:hypothetical protein